MPKQAGPSVYARSTRILAWPKNGTGHSKIERPNQHGFLNRNLLTEAAQSCRAWGERFEVSLLRKKKCVDLKKAKSVLWNNIIFSSYSHIMSLWNSSIKSTALSLCCCVTYIPMPMGSSQPLKWNYPLTWNINISMLKAPKSTLKMKKKKSSLSKKWLKINSNQLIQQQILKYWLPLQTSSSREVIKD